MKLLIRKYTLTSLLGLGMLWLLPSCIVYESHPVYGHHYRKAPQKMPPGQVKKYYGIHPKHQKKGRW